MSSMLEVKILAIGTQAREKNLQCFLSGREMGSLFTLKAHPSSVRHKRDII